MLPTINGKPIISCNKGDFQIIIDNPDYRENEYIDYKESFSFLGLDKRDPKKQNIKQNSKAIFALLQMRKVDTSYMAFETRKVLPQNWLELI